MNFEPIVEFFFSCIGKLIAVLNQPIFSYGGVTATLWQIMASLIFISMVISIFWKGAKG